MNKVLGTESPADMGTKGLNGDQIHKFVRMLNMEHREGRAELAPDLNKLLHTQQCMRHNSYTNKVTITPLRQRDPKKQRLEPIFFLIR